MLRRSATFCIALLLGVALAGPQFARAQTITINEARTEPLGTEVTFEGTVTRAFGAYARIQDTSGPTGASAIVLRQTFGDLSDAFQADIEDGTIQPGTVLRITGSTSEFNGLLQVNNTDLVSYETVGETSVPSPQSVTLSDLTNDGEDYESELVTVGPLSFSGGGTEFNNGQTYTVENLGGTTFDLRVQGDDETAVGGSEIPDGAFTYVGVVGQFNATYQLIPVRSTDFQQAPSFRLNRTFAVGDEGGEVSVRVIAENFDDGDSGSVTVSGAGGSATLGGDVTGFSDPSIFSFSGPDPEPETLTFTLATDGDTEGVEYVDIEISSNDAGIAEPSRFTIWVRDDALAQTTLFAGETGSELLNSLQGQFGDPETLGYDSAARDTLYGLVYNRDDRLRGLYTGFEVPFVPSAGDPSDRAGDVGFNTEHIWPRSKGSENEPALSNMYILAPTRGSVNSRRLNYPFGEIEDVEAEWWFADDDSTRTPPPPLARDAWTEFLTSTSDPRVEPRESVKGDIARAMFYFDAMYRNLADQAFFAAQDTTLLQWHLADPVDADEVLRTIQIGTYQSKKLNPFVLDPTLPERLYDFGDVAPAPVTRLRARLNLESVRLDWKPKVEDDLLAYRIYRSVAPEAPTASQTPIAVVDAGGGTSYVDAGLDASQTYRYRITAVDVGGNESALSNQIEASPLPGTVDATVTGVFGDPSNARNYRLVALPGTVDLPLGQTLDGPPGDAWQAYWDDGSGDDFVAFDGSETFNLRPGRGFWVIGNAPWTVDRTFDAVQLADDGTYTLTLHDGWNIVSNPLDADVAWTDIQAANPSPEGEGSAVGTLWQWSGGFVPASVFASAQGGQAYYLFVNDGPLDLTVPYPGAVPDGFESASPSALRLTASVDGRPSSVVEAGLTPEARDGLDRFDEVAPPSRFQPATLYWTPSDDASTAASKAANDDAAKLAREFRAPRGDGHTFDLTLDATPGQAVTLTASGLDAFDGQRVVLVDRSTGRSYDVTNTSTIRLVPETSSTPLRLVAGTDAFVRSAEAEIEPEQTTLLPAYPNPFAGRTTIEYTLDEGADVRLAVYDLLGRRVALLADGQQQAGFHRIEWDGGRLASGMYLVRLTADGRQFTHKLVRVR